MQLSIVVCTLNALALFWLLFNYVNIGLKYKNWKGIDVMTLIKPFDCEFCMMFWCSFVSVALYLLFPVMCNHLIMLSLPTSLAYLINKLN